MVFCPSLLPKSWSTDELELVGARFWDTYHHLKILNSQIASHSGRSNSGQALPATVPAFESVLIAAT